MENIEANTTAIDPGKAPVDPLSIADAGLGASCAVTTAAKATERRIRSAFTRSAREATTERGETEVCT